MKLRSIKVKFKNLYNDCDLFHDYHYDILEYDNISQFELRGHLESLQGKKSEICDYIYKTTNSLDSKC